jgi:hypothetical protein
VLTDAPITLDRFLALVFPSFCQGGCSRSLPHARFHLARVPGQVLTIKFTRWPPQQPDMVLDPPGKKYIVDDEGNPYTRIPKTLFQQMLI